MYFSNKKTMSDNMNQMHLDLPHDVVLLPSEGKYYKNKKKIC